MIVAGKSSPLAALLAASALLVAGCGEKEEPSTAPTADQFTEMADASCADGSREAIDLPLPDSARKVAADARARAEILTGVRDGIAAIGSPEGLEPVVDSYLAELDADIELLDQERRLDESAGTIALELDLRECAGFANAIARTP